MLRLALGIAVCSLSTGQFTDSIQGEKPPFKERVRVIWEWKAEAAGDQFGWEGRVAGDVDGDGVLDALVSAPSHKTTGPWAGAAYVYSGKTGKLIHKTTGSPGDAFGMGISGVGDIDGDGCDDFAVGAPQLSRGKGSLRVFSGKSGEMLFRRSGERKKDSFGQRLCGCGDVDGDGTPDILVGAAKHDGPEEKAKDAGSAYLFSGKTRKLLRRFDGERAGDNFGSVVAGRGDGDNTLLVIGAPAAGDKKSGRVYVFRGWPAKLAFKVDADATGAQLGYMFMSVVGDVDGDGQQDVYATDWGNAAKGKSTGRAYVFSGKDGKPIHTWTGAHAGAGFGIGPGTAGDCDGDGHADVIVGAWQNREGAPSGGKTYLYSGKTGAVLRTMTCTAKGDTFGFDACGIGDVDGDGAIDFLITSAWSGSGGAKSGRVFVIAGISGS